MFIGISIVIYIVSFKDDFTEQYIEKSAPFIFIVSIILILVGIIGSLR